MAKSNKLPDLTIDQIEEALNNINPDRPRSEWVDIAMGLHSELGDAGFDLFDRWSSKASSYKAASCKHVWNSIEPGGISIGTVLYWAKQDSGWSIDPEKIVPMSDEEKKARHQRRKDYARQAAEATRARQEAARDQSKNMWDSAGPVESHPYLKAKKVGAYGLRVGAFAIEKASKPGEYITLQRCLLIPLTDMAGDIQMLQAIPAKREKWMTTSNKFFTKGGDKIGHFHRIGEINGTVAFCEGYATGAAVHEATGWCVIVCFDSGNLLPVAKLFAAEMIGQQFVVCGDNDAFTKGNPGARAAKEVGNLIRARVLLPEFTQATIDANTRTDEKGKVTGPTDFNDLLVLEGAEAVTRQLDPKVAIMAFPERKQDAAPPQPSYGFTSDEFAVLGYNDGKFYYLPRGSGQITALAPGSHTQLPLCQLAPLDWWAANFPLPGAKIDWAKAASDLMELCFQKGIFSPEQIRGRGAWFDDGRSIFHFGPHLLVDGVETDLVDITSDYTYQKQLSLGVPAAEPLSKEDGMKILEVANAFRWRLPASAALLAGFVALAPICGALSWRPHLWITGGAGCGKSTVMNYFCDYLLGKVKIFAQGSSSEAGIRQRLGNDAIPVLFEESESNNEGDSFRVQNILSMVRQASSESGAQTLKGSGNGVAMTYTIRSMFCFASIQVALKQQADLERLTVLGMRGKHEQTEEDLTWDDVRAQLARLASDRGMPARLFRRSLDLLPVTLKNVQTFVDAASKYFGTVREGDQYGTLLAGAWSLISDDAATPEQAMAEIESYDWEEITVNARADESTEALQRILMLTQRTGAGTDITLQDLASQAAGRSMGAGIDQKEAQRMLRTIGMRVGDGGLIIANNCTWIERKLRDTKFAADWRGQLLRVEGVQSLKKQYKIGGINSRCLLIPSHLLLDDPSQEALI